MIFGLGWALGLLFMGIAFVLREFLDVDIELIRALFIIGLSIFVSAVLETIIKDGASAALRDTVSELRDMNSKLSGIQLELQGNRRELEKVVQKNAELGRQVEYLKIDLTAALRTTKE